MSQELSLPQVFPKHPLGGKPLKSTLVLEIYATPSSFGNNIADLLISICPSPTSVSQLVST